MELLRVLNKNDFPTRTASYTGTAGNTATWPQGVTGVLVWSDQACFVQVGEGAVATTGSLAIPANTPIPIHVPDGIIDWRVSALQISTGGTIYATPISEA